MGRECKTVARVAGRESRCVVLLETSEIILRAPLRRRFALTDLARLAARDGWLSFEAAGEPVAIQLGDAAADWADRIRNPRTRVQKLGLRPGQRVCLLGPAEDGVADELAAATGAKPGTRLAAGVELVLLFAERPQDLARLEAIESKLAVGGAVWVLWPKGRSDLKHEGVVAAARGSRLVQTRSMGFSERLTGLRLTRPAR